ncbi:hypothetical protein ACP70R_017210 [Stipagrostis hirtigluma subsp. patula]
MHSVRNDMIMLENQMPLIVLDLLHRLRLGNAGVVASLAVSLLRAKKQRPVAKRRQQIVHVFEGGVPRGRRPVPAPRHGPVLGDVFEGGVLRISRIFIHDDTKALFLNLTAFEQGNTGIGNDISTYAIFMDNLINSAEDVRYLHDRGAIHR